MDSTARPGEPVSRRVNAERMVVLGWPRAILMQLAHPLVAAGVADHSSFRRGTVTAVLRLHHTIRAMLALTFGDEATRTGSLDGIRAIHRRVNGRLRESVGPFPAGTPYSAEDPDLVLWVHATLLDTIPMTYRRLVGDLTAGELDVYCEEAAPIAVDLGARPQDVPRAWPDVQAYLNRMYAAGIPTVSAEAKELAASVLSPPFNVLTGLFTVGHLPAHMRAQYGYAWNATQQRRLDRWCAAARTMRAVTPRVLALWPQAR